MEGKSFAFVVVESLAGNPCRIANPWPGRRSRGCSFAYRRRGKSGDRELRQRLTAMQKTRMFSSGGMTPPVRKMLPWLRVPFVAS
jgi:hypothetical protein